MSSAAPAQPGFFASIGDAVYQLAVAWGDVTDFGLRAFGWLFRRRKAGNNLIPIFFQIGVRSMPVVGITGLFIGMVLAVQLWRVHAAHPQYEGMDGSSHQQQRHL